MNNKCERELRGGGREGGRGRYKVMLGRYERGEEFTC